jgi:hypothetical protein
MHVVNAANFWLLSLYLLPGFHIIYTLYVQLWHLQTTRTDDKKQPKSTQSPLGSKNLTRLNWLGVDCSITPCLVIHSFLSRTFNFNQLQLVQLFSKIYCLYPVVGPHDVSVCYKLFIFQRKALPSFFFQENHISVNSFGPVFQNFSCKLAIPASRSCKPGLISD